MTIEQEIAESSTGIVESPSGLGKYFTGPFNRNGLVHPGGDELMDEVEAYDALRGGDSVVVPNAGAGSYRAFFESLGLINIELWESCSSAGDWTFTVQDGEGGWWYPAFQFNRYPRRGFEYSLNVSEGCETLAELHKLMKRQL